MIVRLFLAAICGFILSCQSKPTRTYTRGSVNQDILSKRLGRPVEVSDKTVFVDARSRFDHAMSHPIGSIYLNWEDFSEPGSRNKGPLQKDLLSLSHRFSVLGINTETPIVVLGPGLSGEGHEGRLAWMMLYLGIKDVQVAEINSLKLRFTNTETPPREKVKAWEPKLSSELLATSKEVKKLGVSKHTGEAFLMDVRSPKEYFDRDKKTETYIFPDLRALNIHWKEFYLEDGRINPEIKEKLLSIGVRPESRIVVLSNQGVRSGAVTFALLNLGFTRAGNFAGGWSELLKPR